MIVLHRRTGEEENDGKIKRPAVGWAYVVVLIDVLCHPQNLICHTFLAKPQLKQRSESHPSV